MSFYLRDNWGQQRCVLCLESLIEEHVCLSSHHLLKSHCLYSIVWRAQPRLAEFLPRLPQAAPPVCDKMSGEHVPQVGDDSCKGVGVLWRLWAVMVNVCLYAVCCARMVSRRRPQEEPMWWDSGVVVEGPEQVHVARCGWCDRRLGGQGHHCVPANIRLLCTTPASPQLISPLDSNCSETVHESVTDKVCVLKMTHNNEM